MREIARILLSEEELITWLALWSGEASAVSIGIELPENVFRQPRPIFEFGWSQEHRISKDQKRKPWAPIAATDVLDRPPEKVSEIRGIYPMGFCLVDYDRSLEGLRRVCDPILEEMPRYGISNCIFAWRGYQQSTPADEVNDVFQYVATMPGSTYHFNGTDIAFRVFNMNGDLKASLDRYSSLR